MTLLRREGAGEVQTPVKLPPGIDIPIGAPLFFATPRQVSWQNDHQFSAAGQEEKS